MTKSTDRLRECVTKGGRGFKNVRNLRDVIYGWSLICNSDDKISFNLNNALIRNVVHLILTITLGYLASKYSEYVVTLSSDHCYKAQRPRVKRSGRAMENLNHATIQAEAKAKAGLGL